MVSLRRFLAVAFALASVALPVAAGTLHISSITGPFGTPVVSSSPFDLPDGLSADGLRWIQTGASAVNSPTSSNLGFAGRFFCSDSCNDTFRVNFNAFGFNPEATVYASLNGFSSGGAFSQLEVFSNFSNGSMTQTFTNSSGVFNVQSSPVLLGSGNFSGYMLFTLQMGPGNYSLPVGTTADIVIADGVTAVPEPATLSILAACILLFFYVKRLRRA